jgi:CheY-like chemotaxis protein
VDDQSFNIDALYIILKYKIGINTQQVCDYCFDGLEAMKIIEKDVEENKNKSLKKIKYDLILIDCNMPFMDGYQTT